MPRLLTGLFIVLACTPHPQLSFFHDIVIDHDVVAIDDCTMLVLHSAAYHRAVAEEPSIQPHLFRKLADLSILQCIYTIPGLRSLPSEVVDSMLDDLDFVEVRCPVWWTVRCARHAGTLAGVEGLLACLSSGTLHCSLCEVLTPDWLFIE